MMASTTIQQNVHELPLDPKPVAFPWDMFQPDSIFTCPSDKKASTVLFENSMPHVGVEFLFPTLSIGNCIRNGNKLPLRVKRNLVPAPCTVGYPTAILLAVCNSGGFTESSGRFVPESSGEFQILKGDARK